MSGLLAGKVWLSALDAHLKPLAATLADIANDDGSSIYPTIAYVAWRLGASERTVTRGIAALLSMNVLNVVREAHHHTQAEYTLIESALPKRADWSEEKKIRVDKLSPLKWKQGRQIVTPEMETGVTSETARGDTDDSLGSHLEQGGVTFGALPLPLSLNDPSVQTSIETSVQRESAPLALRTPEDLVVLWNTHREPGPKVTELSATRRRVYAKALTARPRDTDWILAIRWLNAQAYCNAPGSGKNPTWRATLDFLAREGQLVAVLEQARTDEAAPPQRARRPGDLPTDALTPADEAAKRERLRRREENDRANEALFDQASTFVLDLSEGARAQLEHDVLAELEEFRSRMTPSQFDDAVLRALPKALIDLAHGRPLGDVVNDLERKVAAA